LHTAFDDAATFEQNKAHQKYQQAPLQTSQQLQSLFAVKMTAMRVKEPQSFQ
jgi:hypothetical protein